MSINGIPASSRVAAPVTPVQASDAPARDPRASALIEIDKKTMQPVPLRFPWLSRLSTELEKAAGQPAPFGTNPDLGDRLDAKV
jgi:hypothetical protein